MNWKDEEVEQACEAFRAVNPDGESNPSLSEIRAIMTRAVELAAARGGTMTAERHALMLGLVEVRHVLSSDQASELLASHDALGARVAVLEKTRDDLCDRLLAANTALSDHSACLTRLSTVLGVVSSFQEIESAVESLKERLSAAEEGNRELVRRAQRAEGLLGREQKAGRFWHGRVEAAADELGDVGAGECGRLDIVTRVKMLKARCATRSAAVQVLSAHVDKAGGRCCERDRDGDGNCDRHPRRYPCSPTCTHDDAAKPGHPERVKEMSEAVNKSIRMTIKRSDGTVVSDGMIDLEDDVDDSDPSEDFERGAEAMRAACWEAVASRLEVEGYDRGGALLLGLKSVIEGVAP